jgi:hypothetical protein
MSYSVEDTLSNSIHKGDVAEVLRLFGQHPEYLQQRFRNWVPWLELACKGASLLMVQTLLDLKCDPNEGRNQHETPLLSALGNDRPDIVRLLLDRGADPNKGRCLITAITGLKRCSLENVKLLEQYGADLHRVYLNELSKTPMNALETAVAWGKKDVEAYLRSKGCVMPTTESEIFDDIDAQVQYGWMSKDETSHLTFRPGKEAVEGELPAIKIGKWKKGVVKTLTLPAGGFGLDLTNAEIKAANIVELAPLQQLKILDLNGTQVSSARLKDLAALPELESLSLASTRVSNRGLIELAPLKSLKCLWLCFLNLSDAGYLELAALTQLEFLDLSDTNVTDARLRTMSSLTELRHLRLLGTKVTNAGLETLAGLTRLTVQHSNQR